MSFEVVWIESSVEFDGKAYVAGAAVEGCFDTSEVRCEQVYAMAEANHL